MKLIKNLVVAVAAAVCLATGVAAAAAYPDRPIRMVLGYSAGGPTDVVARVVAKHMSESLGQPVVVENKPGASAHIAANDIMHAAPDGYKVLVTSLTLNVNPLLYPDRYNYEATKVFEPVANFVTLPMVVVTNYKSPYKNMQDLIADAKTHPGKLTFGSSGFGGSAHLTAEMLATQAGLDMVHVPFKGNGPALQEMIAGRISFMFYPSVGIADYVADKRLRILAVGTREPHPDFPGVPTLESMGLTGFEEAASFIGMLAPAGTPKDIVAKLNQAAVAALSKPEVKAQLKQLGANIVGNSPEAFREFLIKDKARWQSVIKHGNVKPE
ncbi:MAG TPA: tripartite tricarboxylate transporter substrate binding protein [Advenella sp.]|nr:tripartite tricarboxylate transporter substrate binding protein [Advenella sp.]